MARYAGSLLVLCGALVFPRVVGAQVAALTVRAGEEAVYVGEVSQTPRFGSLEERSTVGVRLTTFLRREVARDTWEMCQYNVLDDRGMQPQARALFFDYRYETAINLETRSLSQWRPRDWMGRGLCPPPLFVGPPDGAPRLEVGQEWEGTMMVARSTDAHVRCRVAAEEEVAGHSCLRLDLTLAEALPCAVVEHTVYHIVGLTKKPTTVLIAFVARVWVDRDTGWVRKIDSGTSLRTKWRFEDEERTSTSQERLTLALESRGQLPDDELARRNAQLDLVQKAQWLRNGRSYRNPLEDAKRGLQLLATLRRDYPTTPYDTGVHALEQQLVQLRDTNRDFPRPGGYVYRGVGKAAPDLAGTTTDGAYFSIAGLRGKPALLIFLGLPSYNHADEVVPDANTLGREWTAKGVQVFTVAVDGDKGAAMEFKSKYGLALPLVVPAVTRFNTEGGPMRLYSIYDGLGVVVLDSQGIMRHYQGGVYPETLRRVLPGLLGQ